MTILVYFLPFWYDVQIKIWQPFSVWAFVSARFYPAGPNRIISDIVGHFDKTPMNIVMYKVSITHVSPAKDFVFFLAAINSSTPDAI
jgi:hypothetical protein